MDRFTFLAEPPMMGPMLGFGIKKRHGGTTTLKIGVQLKSECGASTSCDLEPDETAYLASMFEEFARACEGHRDYAAEWSDRSGRFSLALALADGKPTFDATMHRASADTYGWRKHVDPGEPVQIVPIGDTATDAKLLAAALRAPRRRRFFA